MPQNLMPWFVARFFTNDGPIQGLAGGKLSTYEAGTLTPKITYKDSEGVTPHTNPIILDSNGYIPNGFFADDSGAYRIVGATSEDVTLFDVDDILPSAGSAIFRLDSIQELRDVAYADNTGSLYIVTGPQTAGGKNKTYYWDENSTEADNGFTVIEPTNGPTTGRWVTFDDTGDDALKNDGTNWPMLAQAEFRDDINVDTDSFDFSPYHFPDAPLDQIILRVSNMFIGSSIGSGSDQSANNDGTALFWNVTRTPRNYSLPPAEQWGWDEELTDDSKDGIEIRVTPGENGSSTSVSYIRRFKDSGNIERAETAFSFASSNIDVSKIWQGRFISEYQVFCAFYGFSNSVDSSELDSGYIRTLFSNSENSNHITLRTTDNFDIDLEAPAVYVANDLEELIYFMENTDSGDIFLRNDTVVSSSVTIDYKMTGGKADRRIYGGTIVVLSGVTMTFDGDSNTQDTLLEGQGIIFDNKFEGLGDLAFINTKQVGTSTKPSYIVIRGDVNIDVSNTPTASSGANVFLYNVVSTSVILTGNVFIQSITQTTSGGGDVGNTFSPQPGTEQVRWGSVRANNGTRIPYTLLSTLTLTGDYKYIFDSDQSVKCILEKDLVSPEDNVTTCNNCILTSSGFVYLTTGYANYHYSGQGASGNTVFDWVSFDTGSPGSVCTGLQNLQTLSRT